MIAMGAAHIEDRNMLRPIDEMAIIVDAIETRAVRSMTTHEAIQFVPDAGGPALANRMRAAARSRNSAAHPDNGIKRNVLKFAACTDQRGAASSDDIVETSAGSLGDGQGGTAPLCATNSWRLEDLCDDRHFRRRQGG